jgi:hypothetical protein
LRASGFIFVIYRFQNQKIGKLLVAAIDFGTTYSGYAFITKDDYEKCMGDNSRIHCPTWAGPGGRSYKAPTTVLFQPNKTFHSFGYEAEKFYLENSDNLDLKEWYYFKHFKMKLYTDKVKSSFVMKAYPEYVVPKSIAATNNFPIFLF